MELKQKSNDFLKKDYLGDLQKIKETIRQNQNKAMVYVNSQMILTYYEIGTIINKRKIWGNKYVQNLSNDLKDFGNSYSTRNLQFMSQFASNISQDEITKRPVSQIPWRSLITIIQKSKSHEEMLWYINQTHTLGWSKSIV